MLSSVTCIYNFMVTALLSVKVISGSITTRPNGVCALEICMKCMEISDAYNCIYSIEGEA